MKHLFDELESEQFVIGLVATTELQEAVRVVDSRVEREDKQWEPVAIASSHRRIHSAKLIGCINMSFVGIVVNDDFGSR